MGVNKTGKVTFERVLYSVESIERDIHELTGLVGVLKHEVARGTPEAVEALEHAEIKLETALNACGILIGSLGTAKLQTKQAAYSVKVGHRIREIIGSRSDYEQEGKNDDN